VLPTLLQLVLVQERTVLDYTLCFVVEVIREAYVHYNDPLILIQYIVLQNDNTILAALKCIILCSSSVLVASTTVHT
jgi:hypothetical protein